MPLRRLRLPTLVALAALPFVAAACGSGPHVSRTTVVHTTAVAKVGLRVGLVGGVGFRASGAYADRGALSRVAGDPLVLVAADAAPIAGVAAAAKAHPAGHFAIVGASARALKIANLAGLLARDDQAAHVAGLLAGLVAKSAGTTNPTVALVGPGEDKVLVDFTNGVHAVDERTVVTGYPADPRPASCKEAALAAIASGALAVISTPGPCADGVRAAALEQHVVGQSLADFEILDAAASITVRQAVHGVYSGKEDVTFGALDGAIGITRLDPLVPDAVAVQARAAAQRYADGLGR